MVAATLQFKNESSVPETSAVEQVLVDEVNNNKSFSLSVNTSTIVATSKNCFIVLLVTLQNAALDLWCNFLI